MTDLPNDAEQALKEVMAEAKRERIFIAMPSLMWTNSHLSRILFDYATSKDYYVNYHFLIEQRFHDWARNKIAQTFLNDTDMEWMLMLDADVFPNPNILQLAKRGKQIIAATVFCWIKRKLMPSIWTRADCEECAAVKEFADKELLKDPSRYRITRKDKQNIGILERWEPFRSWYEPLYCGDTKKHLNECICKGTGKDPWTYMVHPDSWENLDHPFECDSVGAAALMLHRSVFERIEFPWFRFLYKESRQMMCTEDHYFCWNAKRSGYKIYADPTLICGHFKTMDLAEINRIIGLAHKRGVEQERKRMKESDIITVTDVPAGMIPINK